MGDSQEVDRWPEKRVWFAAIVLIQAIIIVSFSVYPIELCLLVFGVICLLAATLFSVRLTLFALILGVVVIPIRFYKYGSIPLYVSPAAYVIGFSLLLFYFVLQILKTRRLRFVDSSLNLPLGLFLVVVWLAAIWGISEGHSVSHVLHEAWLLTFYATFWIVINMPNSGRIVRSLFPILAGVMVIVLLEYLFIAFREPHHVAARGGRIITRQANIALVVFPYLTALLAISPSIKRKIAYLLALSIPLTVAFLHQQRSIWIALIASGIFVWVCVAIKKTRFSFKHMVVGVLTVMALLFVVNYQIGILQRLIDVQMREFIGTRMETFKELRAEPSILVRLIDLQAVFEKIKEHPIIGSGFGATVFRPLGRIYLLIVDNSFVYLYWKTGILGLAIFLWLIIAVFRKCFYVLKRCKDDETLVLVLSITAGMIGLLTVSFASVILVAYRFIIVWATMIAAAELLWLRFKARELEQG